MTAEQLQDVVKAIHTHLTVNKTRLSSSIRKKTSAQDKRDSAQATGYVGLLVLLILFLLIVVPDLISALQYIINNKFRHTARHEGGKSDDVKSRGVTNSSIFNRKKLDDPTQLILMIEVTDLVGIVSLMCGMLLHSDAPSR
ncbi:hypothetical protein ACOMHN_016087 [Nucella lapillus]